MSQTEFTPLPKRQSFQADPLGGFNQYCTLEQAQATRLIFNEVVATVAAAMSRIPVIPENGLSIPNFVGVPDGLTADQVAGESKVGPDKKIYYNFQFTVEIWMNGVKLSTYPSLYNAAMVMNELYRYPNNYVLALNQVQLAGIALP